MNPDIFKPNISYTNRSFVRTQRKVFLSFRESFDIDRLKHGTPECGNAGTPERRNAGTPEYKNPEHKITKTRSAWKINKLKSNNLIKNSKLGC